MKAQSLSFTYFFYEENCFNYFFSCAVYLQNIFTIKPIEHSPQCMTYVPGPHASLEDIILFGDDQGYVNVLTLVAKDLTMKNSKDDRRASQNVAIDPSKLSLWAFYHPLLAKQTYVTPFVRPSIIRPIHPQSFVHPFRPTINFSSHFLQSFYSSDKHLSIHH